MDPDSKRNDKVRKNQNRVLSPSHVLQSAGLRRTLRFDDAVDWVLFGHRYYFLLHLNLLFPLLLSLLKGTRKIL